MWIPGYDLSQKISVPEDVLLSIHKGFKYVTQSVTLFQLFIFEKGRKCFTVFYASIFKMKLTFSYPRGFTPFHINEVYLFCSNILFSLNSDTHLEIREILEERTSMDRRRLEEGFLLYAAASVIKKHCLPIEVIPSERNDLERCLLSSFMMHLSRNGVVSSLIWLMQ